MSEAHTVVGYSCNNNCIHCFNSGIIEQLRREKVPLDQITSELKRLILDIKNRSFESIVFTGGEPTIRRDFFEILKFARKSGLKTGLQTNGRMFCSREFAEKTLRIAPECKFTLSFHHTNPRVQDRITQVQGSWSQTVDGIKNLVSFGAGKRIFLKIVISKHNYKNLAKMVVLGKELGVGGIIITFPQAGGRSLEYWRKIMLKYTKIEKALLEPLALSKKIGLSCSVNAVPLCFLGRYKNCALELSYVKMWMEGEGIERNLIGRNENILREMELSNRRKPVSCKKCRYFKVCEGAWEEYFKLYGTEEFKPIGGKPLGTLEDLQEARLFEKRFK